MPELPEVEIVKRGLQSLIVDDSIQRVETNKENMFTDSFETFKAHVENKKIKAIHRRGKYLLIQLSTGVIVSHLRMEGKYRLVEHVPCDKHIHVVFTLASHHYLTYRDVRTFGRFTYYDSMEEALSHLNIGVEPVLPDFDAAQFSKDLKRYKTPIKNVLLNQKVVAGLGNIYVDEVLFQAKIRPTRSANTLNEAEIKALHQAIIDIMAKAIECGGTTIRTYENTFGENGHYQNHLKVYGKAHEPCVRCHTPIEKIKLQGRGTHFCPNCQR